MIVYRYDKTFEGLLTAVFDAYNRKMFPDCLLGEEEVEPLFAGEVHRVATETAKSARVWSALEKKLPAGACRMLMLVWLSELPESDHLLFRYIRKVFDTPHAVETDFRDSEVLQVKNIAQKVNREQLRLIQFVRFQKAADGTFFAPVSPVYNVLPLALSYFTGRFAGQRWFVYDLKRRYGYYYDLEKAEEVTLAHDEHLSGGWLDDGMMAEDEKLYEELWKGYFNAVTIKERINPRLQRQHLPRRFWKYLPEMR
jgi:probable DNA metabolism protein